MDSRTYRVSQRSRSAALALLGLFLAGCSVLDFGGDENKPFEFSWGWDHGIEKSEAKPGSVDEYGVYQPETSSIDSVLGFPNIHTGVALEVKPESRITPIVSVEIFRMKFPYVKWWELQVGAGSQLAEISFTKRLISVFEVTVGPWIGWDFEEHDYSWGVVGTLIKF